MFHFQNETDKRDFLALLERYEPGWDPDVKMHRRPFSSPGYHTTLTGGDVHSTRDSLVYAVALFDSGKPELIQRGKEIALKVVSLQDTDESHNTYGIWSWFYEEPLPMMAPPDWNWADFCGKELLQILKDHSEHLNAVEYDTLKTAVYHACRSIMRRDVTPAYTNISFMGAYVTYIAGELLGFSDVLDYAVRRVKQAHDYNMALGNFEEYNSPTYTLIAVEDLSKLHRDMQNETDKALVWDLVSIAWKTILTHLHFPTKQWAGPHKRNYTETLKPEVQVKLQRALGERIIFLPEEELAAHVDLAFYRNDLRCPGELADRYLREQGSWQVFERFARNRYEEGGEEIAVTNMTDAYTLGSFYKDYTWNQRRGIIAYFGEEAFCFRLRCLHDFYDYSSGFVVSAQQGGELAGVLAFATDGGDTHVNLDMVQDKTIEAADLRVRFTVSGPIRQMGECTALNGSSFGFSYKKKLFAFLNVVHAAFGDFPVSYDVSMEEDAVHYDVILYHGERRGLDFGALHEAVVGFTLEFAEDADAPRGTADCSIQDGALAVNLHGAQELKASCPVRPATFRELFTEAHGEIANTPVNELV